MAYLPLSTANLPDPVIDPAQGSSPEDYFDVALYTGNGTSTEVSTLSFQPDFVWGKKRSSAGSHFLLDAVRGVNSTLSSDTTGAEDTSTDIFTSFDSDGFTVGANGQSNSNGVTYASWNWKANGSGVSNTDGSITSTVSANTTSGFSVVSYSGNSTVGATIGHGLSQAPEFVIFKARNTALSWIIQADALGSPDAGNYILFTTAAKTANNTVNTTFGASTITLDSSATYNGTGGNYIAYCFHSVEGFSRFSSYVGNGSTDGPFVYTGFRPAFVMIKNISAVGNWGMWDTKRNGENVAYRIQRADTSDAEATAQPNNNLDIVSNGFKVRGNTGLSNTSGASYIYMAFAENPFKYSTAR